MAKPPILGYVVVRKHEFNVGALELCFGHDFPTGGILLWGDDATMFDRHAIAKAAIDRTVIFWNRAEGIAPKTPASPKEFKIQPVRERGRG